jgi:hypothetical protein
MIAVQHVDWRPTVKVFDLMRGFKILFANEFSYILNRKFANGFDVLAGSSTRIIRTRSNKFTMEFCHRTLEHTNHKLFLTVKINRPRRSGYVSWFDFEVEVAESDDER